MIGNAIFLLVGSYIHETFGDSRSQFWNQDMSIFEFSSRGLLTSTVAHESFHLFAWSIIFTISYFIIFLGVARLVVDLLRNSIPASNVTLFSGAVTVLLFVAAIAIPLTVELSVSIPVWTRIEFIQIVNPYWTIAASLGLDSGLPGGSEPMFKLGIPGFAAIVMLLNFVTAGKEVAQLRAATPRRVLEVQS